MGQSPAASCLPPARTKAFGDDLRRRTEPAARRKAAADLRDAERFCKVFAAPRPWVQRILAYWTLITLGPLLIGISLSLSTYFELAARQVGLGQEAVAWFASSWLHSLARAIPAVLEFVALTLLYCLIPNCAVRWRDGALGALIA